MIRIANGWKLFLMAVIAFGFALAGVRYVIAERSTLAMQRELARELSVQRALVREKRLLERRLFELKALPSVTWRARELLGMRPPGPDETIQASEGMR